MNSADETYFEIKNELSLHAAANTPVPEDLIMEAQFYNVPLPMGIKVAWDEDIDGQPITDVAYQDSNPFGIWKGGD